MLLYLDTVWQVPSAINDCVLYTHLLIFVLEPFLIQQFSQLSCDIAQSACIMMWSSVFSFSFTSPCYCVKCVCVCAHECVSLGKGTIKQL